MLLERGFGPLLGQVNPARRRPAPSVCVRPTAALLATRRHRHAADVRTVVKVARRVGDRVARRRRSRCTGQQALPTRGSRDLEADACDRTRGRLSRARRFDPTDPTHGDATRDSRRRRAARSQDARRRIEGASRSSKRSFTDAQQFRVVVVVGRVAPGARRRAPARRAQFKKVPRAPSWFRPRRGASGTAALGGSLGLEVTSHCALQVTGVRTRTRRCPPLVRVRVRAAVEPAREPLYRHILSMSCRRVVRLRHVRDRPTQPIAAAPQLRATSSRDVPAPVRDRSAAGRRCCTAGAPAERQSKPAVLHR